MRFAASHIFKLKLIEVCFSVYIADIIAVCLLNFEFFKHFFCTSKFMASGSKDLYKLLQKSQNLKIFNFLVCLAPKDNATETHQGQKMEVNISNNNQFKPLKKKLNVIILYTANLYTLHTASYYIATCNTYFYDINILVD
jgi:hypothetical protein